MNNRALLSLLLLSVALTACGGSTPSIDDFLPPVPATDGSAQSVWAGSITNANTEELISGPAQTGLVGDFYIRNSKARFVIQTATRSIGVLPFGGTVVDAVPLDAQGNDLAEDHLGEVGMLYMAGRTCAHETIEVLLDGSGGGPAMIRATGRSAVNDFINLKGMNVAILRIPDTIDPDIEDSVECATTYILQPDAVNLEIAWTLFNPAPEAITGPFAVFADTGGNVSTFAPDIGYFRLSLSDIASVTADGSTDYVVIQGPGVAYGSVPRLDDPTMPVGSINLLGISVQIIKAKNLLDIVNADAWLLNLAQNDGITQWSDLVVGIDAGDINEFFHTRSGAALPIEVSGTVLLQPSGSPAPFARVGVYTDANTDGVLDADDPVVTFFDADDTGAYSGALPPGDYLFEADIIDVGRTNTLEVTVGASAVAVPDLDMPDMVRVDFEIRDFGGNLIPAKITVIGNNPVPLNSRIHHKLDRSFGIVNIAQSVYGTTQGAISDPPLFLPAGGPYRLFAARGPEWSIQSFQITPAAGDTVLLNFQLVHVVDTTGYVATEFHQHALGSPDSIIPFEERLRSLVTEGIEFFASTDHDFLTDYDPFIDALALRDWIDGVVGVESTPFAWGHFIGFPLNIDNADPNRGAADWATGAMAGFDMLPGELFVDLRGRGAQIVQVNHPRTTSPITNFQQYFDRVGLRYDFANKAIFGEQAGAVLASWIRQPEDMDLFSTNFDALEVWNGFGVEDTDGDGIRENTALDLVLRDWMNLLSFGKVTAPMGNSDTHSNRKDPAGMPRTLVRVSDDSATAIAAGLDSEIYATLLGDGVPMDMIVTNGPMLAVSADGGTTSALGQVITAGGNAVTLTIVATSPEWVTFDTIEIFANSTFDPRARADEPISITPLVCYTTRNINNMDPADPCLLAPLAPMPMSVVPQNVAGGQSRWTAIVTVNIDAGDVSANTRAGATGADAWMSVRVRGQRPVFPVFTGGALTPQNIDAIIAATGDAQLETALGLTGVPATAITSPIFVDFDGGGYIAPFAP